MQRLVGLGPCNMSSKLEKEQASVSPKPRVQVDKEELKQKLTPMQFYVTQMKGTERAGSGEYLHTKDPGVYECIVCNAELFSSDSKFESGCGWPVFYDIVDQKNIRYQRDTQYGMIRTEVLCSKCGAHLGHVFDERVSKKIPTGHRYCVNSAALKFRKKINNNDDPPT